ncbi:MAG: hypothetical protein ACYDEQ_10095, partial [Desulfocucumaceae bacterium]
MSLRKKTAIIIAITLAVLVVVLFVISNVRLKMYLDLQNENTINNVNRALNALSNNIAALDSGVADWSAWDETCDFIA